MTAAKRTRVAKVETPDDRKERLWELYAAGASLSDVATANGRTPEAVRAMFNRMGKTLRPATYREPAFYERKALKLEAEATRLRKVATYLRTGRDPAELLAATTSKHR